jgi:uncharacterized membrane protein YdjX (TVP38/TMEM64 family)
MIPARLPKRLVTVTIALAVVAAVIALSIRFWGAAEWSEWPEWQLQHQQLLMWQQHQPWLFGLGFFTLFILLSATALPGCSLLALAAGACFGWVGGTLLVVLASTVGATLSFLAARHWLRAGVQRRWGHRLGAIEAGLARDGARYLFTLRLAPVIPFALLNLMMGLSHMRTRTFFCTSLFGMLAGSAVYVHAGQQMASAGSVQGLWSPDVLGALALLALLPWAGRLYVRVTARMAAQ